MPAARTDGQTMSEQFAARLRQARKAAGLTQQEVAERIGVTRRAVWVWENEQVMPRTALPALAALYRVSETFLLYGIEPASAELRELRQAFEDLARLVADNNRQLAEAFETIQQHAEALTALSEQVADYVQAVQDVLDALAERVHGSERGQP